MANPKSSPLKRASENMTEALSEGQSMLRYLLVVSENLLDVGQDQMAVDVLSDVSVLADRLSSLEKISRSLSLILSAKEGDS